MRKAFSMNALKFGIILILPAFLAGGVSFFWTRGDAFSISVETRLLAPNAEHWLGTDIFGRDVFAMLILGARNTLSVAMLAVGLGLVFGTLLGGCAAWYGGRLAMLIRRSGDLIFSFPVVLTAVMLAAGIGPGALAAICAIALFSGTVFLRVANAAVLEIKSAAFLEAAMLAGKNDATLFQRHVLPNIAGVLAAQAGTQISIAVLADSAFGYLGLGMLPPQPSWGRMLHDARTLLASAPWLTLWPGFAIAITVLGFTLLGEGLRSYANPKQREKL